MGKLVASVASLVLTAAAAHGALPSPHGGSPSSVVSGRQTAGDLREARDLERAAAGKGSDPSSGTSGVARLSVGARQPEALVQAISPGGSAGSSIADPVPEPAIIFVMGSALLGIGVWARRRLARRGYQ